jgi:hypothetical protein
MLSKFLQLAAVTLQLLLILFLMHSFTLDVLGSIDLPGRRKLYVVLGRSALGVALAGAAVGLTVMESFKASDKVLVS